MCPIKPVKHYFLASASVAEWLAFKADSRTTHIRVSPAAKRFRQMHAKINIFYAVLIQNIENGKLHRQVDSVDAGLNLEGRLVPCFFLSVLFTRCSRGTAHNNPFRQSTLNAILS